MENWLEKPRIFLNFLKKEPKNKLESPNGLKT